MYICSILYLLGSVVQKLDSAIHGINRYPEDKYYEHQLGDLLDSNLSNNNSNNKLYLHDHNKLLQYCKSYLKLIIDSL